jgi:hypothetical protein
VHLNSTFQKVSRKFAIDFDDLASEVAHRQSAGEAREHALIELLRKNLPSRVGVEQGGFIIDAHGNESAEMDVVIYDKSLGTVFNAIEGEKYFPCSCSRDPLKSLLNCGTPQKGRQLSTRIIVGSLAYALIL